MSSLEDPILRIAIRPLVVELLQPDGRDPLRLLSMGAKLFRLRSEHPEVTMALGALGHFRREEAGRGSDVPIT